MIREIIATVILVTLLILSLLNANFITNRANGICETLEVSENFSVQGDEEEALDYVKKSFDEWISLKDYAYVFLRQSEFDDVTASFGMLVSSIEEKGTATSTAYRLVKLQIDAITSIERFDIHSVF